MSAGGPTRYSIPFNKPFLTGGEFANIEEAIRQGHISGDGAFTKRCQALLEEILGSPKVLLTTSCTDALELAALLLGLREGDEVILPSYTFVSTANAFVIHGATPVFADVRPDTLNLDPDSVAALMTPRTRVIVPVHYAGVGCDMEALLRIAGEGHASVVEDAAQALFGRYRGRPLGSFGAAAAFSFHETKNVSCGEGGAIAINDVSLVERAEILREKGTNRSKFFRGEVDKYTWVDVGSSFLPSDLLAAYLLAQLEARERIQELRRDLWTRYRDALAPWASANGTALPGVPAECEQPYHMFYLILPTAEARTRLIAHLRSRGILAVFHYVPLHLAPMGRAFGGREGQLPVTERIAERLVRLPFFNGMTGEQFEAVVDAVLEFEP
ncbi:MAG TPA: dTDP-4-amino-4,6-dideoxygalactose transaminase [Thermoanaerobaculia bacterium]|nr:dTDP-4-amino-4,6-dideoxygalactose transaminase [Thermoanaerobaculia bacterium]